MLLLCKHVFHLFPFKEGEGAFLEMDSRGTWTLLSVVFMHFVLFWRATGFKTTVETGMLPTLTWHPCSLSWKQRFWKQSLSALIWVFDQSVRARFLLPIFVQAMGALRSRPEGDCLSFHRRAGRCFPPCWLIATWGAPSDSLQI